MVPAPVHLSTDEIEHIEQPPTLIMVGKHHQPTLITSIVGLVSVWKNRRALSRSTEDWMWSRICPKMSSNSTCTCKWLNH